jgi:hypothetical protein
MKKHNMKAFIGLAEHLFELEIERIGNDPEIHFGDLGNDWTEKFGEKSLEFADKFLTPEDGVKELAKMLQEDFEAGHWEADKEGMYHYEMPDTYGGFICDCLEKQLADFTGVGTQLEIF